MSLADFLQFSAVMWALGKLLILSSQSASL